MSRDLVTGTTAFLQPGELLVARKPVRVKTVLGSCVAITMRDRRLNMAAIAHCLLPQAGTPVDGLSRREALRFVDTTIELMLRGFAGRGVAPCELEIKLFGGAEGCGSQSADSPYGVGRRNVAAARAALTTRGMEISRSDVGGKKGRVIEFDTRTGEVIVQRLARPAARVREESEGGAD